MSDKNLTELEWKKFSKGKGYKDSAFNKAIASLEKAKSDAALQLDALKDIEKEADSLRKANKADKELVSYLDDLDKALDKQRKLSDFEARKQAKDAAKDSGDDEEETPALLTTRMVPLIRQVRKGEEMQVMLASTGKEVAVLMSRRGISPSKRKLMTDYLDAGTPKFFLGTAIFEENAVTFVLKTQAAGLAKKVKAALLKQTELRLKVRVRGEDPNDIDQDGEDEDEGSPAESTDTGGKAKSADEERYTRRIEALTQALADALKAQHPEAGKLRAVIGFASDKAAGGDFTGAGKALDMLEKLLAIPVPGAGASSGNAALDKALEGWRKARADVLLQLKDVVADLKEDIGADPDDKLAKEAELEVNAVMRQLTAEPRSLQQVNELTRWVTQDDVVTDVDAHFGGNVREPLAQALEALKSALGQPA